MPSCAITYPWRVNGVLVAELDALVEFSYSPGAKATWTNPADPPEVEVVYACLLGVEKPYAEVAAPAWLLRDLESYATTECFERLCEAGEDYIQGEREYAAEMRAEFRGELT